MCIDSTDIGTSDHFLVWVELGRTAKNSRKQKRTNRRWHFDRVGDDVVRENYCRQRLRPFQRELVRWRKEE